ncbi:hypothetical protein HPG69_001464 [Diceros bicornis minor]|uniref:glucuronosyltransferase n=1 Tax=Diceros bicornis minor TaxID=77932 RepID=A0A7J7FFK4_DICBM|nr:hypothetical protein HPG69_001464 [Diceros bicornis minor]
MKTILDELAQRCHEVSVLTSSAALLVDPSKASAIKSEIYPTSLTKHDYEVLFRNLINKGTEYSDCIEKLCKDVVVNKKLITKLQESRFDVLLADAIGPCGELRAELLKISLVYSLRFSPGYTIEKYSGGLPFPPSIVPVVMSELSDQMTFMEKTKNMIYVLYFDFWFQTFNERNNLFNSVAMVLLFYDGTNLSPQEMEESTQMSGDNGIVVFTLRSMVINMTEERAGVIASALDQIPQKVRPSSLYWATTSSVC